MVVNVLQDGWSWTGAGRKNRHPWCPGRNLSVARNLLPLPPGASYQRFLSSPETYWRQLIGRIRRCTPWHQVSGEKGLPLLCCVDKNRTMCLRTTSACQQRPPLPLRVPSPKVTLLFTPPCTSQRRPLPSPCAAHLIVERAPRRADIVPLPVHPVHSFDRNRQCHVIDDSSLRARTLSRVDVHTHTRRRDWLLRGKGLGERGLDGERSVSSRLGQLAWVWP
jgi:hypothetical protein